MRSVIVTLAGALERYRKTLKKRIATKAKRRYSKSRTIGSTVTYLTQCHPSGVGIVGVQTFKRPSEDWRVTRL
jgi:hypothetical protein